MDMSFLETQDTSKYRDKENGLGCDHQLYKHVRIILLIMSEVASFLKDLILHDIQKTYYKNQTTFVTISYKRFSLPQTQFLATIFCSVSALEQPFTTW